jgi:programmed cell death 6-interacting protein
LNANPELNRQKLYYFSICRYYDSLLGLEGKCPPSELQIPFKWKDAFEKSSSFIVSNTLTLNNLQYEKVCVLFNMASVSSQIAASLGTESLISDVGLKQMAKHFQLACGIFQALKHLTAPLGEQLFTYDFQKEVLNVLYLVMLAQAQESFYYKAAKDKMKPMVLARICHQAYEYYSEAASNVFSIRVNIERNWSPLLTMKTAAFKALSEYYQSMVCDEGKKFGEEIARLEKAIGLMTEANCKGNSSFDEMIRDTLAKAKHKLGEVRKDNDFIYHLTVPDVKLLESIGNATIAKPTPIPDKFLPQITDSFSQLLPLSVQQAVHKLDVRKQDLVAAEVVALREQATLLSGVLASLNLPASLEDNAGDNELPKSLLEKATILKDGGGLESVETKITELPGLMQRNIEILDETDRMIAAEEESDKRLREKFGSKWIRSRSEDLNGFWKEQVAKYRKIVENALTADQVVKQKFETHRNKIALLSGSESELKQRLPNASRSDSEFAESRPAQVLRQLMDEVEQFKQRQEQLNGSLNTATFDDMKSKFLSALADDGKINEEALSVEALGEVYGPLQKKGRDLKKEQEELIERIRLANEEFVAIKFGSGGEDQREKFLVELASAYDAYQEINGNLKEGINFYADLTKLLLGLQSKVNDFCFARKAERDELVKDLQDSSFREHSPEAIAKPAHHDVKQTPPTPSGPPASGPTPYSGHPPPATAATPQHPGAPGQPGYGPPPNAPYAAPYGNPYQQYFYPPPPLPQQYPVAYPNYYVPGQYPNASYPGYGQPGQPAPQPQGYPGYPNQPYPQQPPK